MIVSPFGRLICYAVPARGQVAAGSAPSARRTVDFDASGRAWRRAWEPAWKCPWNRTVRPATGAALRCEVRLLGPLTISRDGVAAGAAGVAQGARAARLSGARAARRSRAASSASCCGTSPTIRAASCAGASARSGASSTSPAGAGSTRAPTPSRLDLADCFVDAIEIAARRRGGHRDAWSPSGCATLSALVRRRLSRRPGDRPQPGLRRLAHRAAAPLPRLPRRAAGASRQERSGRRGVRLSGEVAAACAVRSARARDAAERACPARPRSRRRGASGGGRADCSRPKASIRRRFAMHGVRPGRRPAPLLLPSSPTDGTRSAKTPSRLRRAARPSR